MTTNIVTSKAKRPKNAWYVFSTKVSGTYEISLGYKNSKGDAGPYSSSQQNVTVKVPWGPPTECEYRVRKVNADEIVKEFKFSNSRRETAAFDEAILNSLNEVNTLSQRITSLFTDKEGRKKLLANYLTVTQYAKDFVHHTDSYDEDGFRLDGKGVKLTEVEANGGSLSELRNFINVAKESAIFGDSVQEAYAEVFKFAETKRKRKSDGVGSKPIKLSKKAAIENNEKAELEDPEGLEKKLQSSYLGCTWIPLDNISVSKELNIKPNIYRVFNIMQSMKSKYDPSQTIIVVAPKDDTQILELKNLSSDQKFVVVQKVHTLNAFKDLDKKGEFAKLTGHSQRKVLCYVVNTRSLALLRYGHMRANDISNKFAQKTYPQDILHVFETLSANDSSVNSLKVVERVAKLNRVGPNEATALRKICKWNPSAFRCLMEVLEVYEAYETLDVKTSGNAGRISRGEKLCLPNTVFNELAKVEEAYFEENFQKVISKKISLKSLINDSLQSKEVHKTYSALSQISGYRNVEALKQQYPGKFDVNIVEKFIGAELNGDKRNLKAVLLENYYNDVTKRGLGSEDIPVKFEKVVSLEDSIDPAVADNFNAVVVHMKEAQKELCLSLIKKVLHSDKRTHVGIFVFPNELLYFEVLSFLRAQNTSLLQNFQIIPVSFFSGFAPIVNSIQENIKHGIIFGKFSILKPPLKVYYSNMKMLTEVLENIVPPKSRVASITEPGLSVVQVHTEQLFFNTVYYGSEEEIAKFKRVLDKDKQLFRREDASLQNLDDESSTSPVKENISRSPDESSTSPIKVNDSPESQDSTQDSGFDSPDTRMLNIRSNLTVDKFLDKSDIDPKGLSEMRSGSSAVPTARPAQSPSVKGSSHSNYDPYKFSYAKEMSDIQKDVDDCNTSDDECDTEQKVDENKNEYNGAVGAEEDS